MYTNKHPNRFDFELPDQDLLGILHRINIFFVVDMCFKLHTR